VTLTDIERKQSELAPMQKLSKNTNNYQDIDNNVYSKFNNIPKKQNILHKAGSSQMQVIPNSVNQFTAQMAYPNIVAQSDKSVTKSLNKLQQSINNIEKREGGGGNHEENASTKNIIAVSNNQFTSKIGGLKTRGKSQEPQRQSSNIEIEQALFKNKVNFPNPEINNKNKQIRNEEEKPFYSGREDTSKFSNKKNQNMENKIATQPQSLFANANNNVNNINNGEIPNVQKDEQHLFLQSHTTFRGLISARTSNPPEKK
jgi:hypothetical protein